MNVRLRFWQACLAFCLVCGGGASAPSLACPVTYRTVIGERDLKNSSGQNLTTLGAIVRQDRANYHKFHRRDAGDGDDAALSDDKRRIELEAAVNRAHPDYDVDPFFWDAEFGTVLSVTFWQCESPPRAHVEDLGIAKPSVPHPAFGREPDQDLERKLNRLPPPPK